MRLKPPMSPGGDDHVYGGLDKVAKVHPSIHTSDGLYPLNERTKIWRSQIHCSGGPHQRTTGRSGTRYRVPCAAATSSPMVGERQPWFQARAGGASCRFKDMQGATKVALDGN